MKPVPAEQKQSLLRSKFVWSAALLLFINIGVLWIIPFGKGDPTTLPSPHSWEWWRTTSYLSTPSAPDVVLLGSSLIMKPSEMLDAQYRQKTIDSVHHDRSWYLQDRLAIALGTKGLSCVNFGLPGAMISDDYMVARCLFDEKKPKLVVLGITVRDFIESHVSYPAGTHSFKYFQQFSDIEDILTLAMPQVWQRADYMFGRYYPLWGKRLQMQASADACAKKAIAPIQSSKITINPLKGKERKQILAGRLKSIAEEGDAIEAPNNIIANLFQDNSYEYRSRFRRDNKPLFDIESVFLAKLLKLLHDQEIAVLIVNMPLMPANMQLMPEGAYARYMETAQRIAAQNDCKFLDLNNPQRYTIGKFCDTAHMNWRGGKQFMDDISCAITTDDKLNLAITSNKHAGSLAGRASLTQ